MTFHDEVLSQMSALITAAFGLVAALAWNGAIQSLFKKVFGTADTLNAQIAYAILVTVIAVGITMWIARATAKVKEHIKKIE
jgi:hypothetical protein